MSRHEHERTRAHERVILFCRILASSRHMFRTPWRRAYAPPRPALASSAVFSPRFPPSALLLAGSAVAYVDDRRSSSSRRHVVGRRTPAAASALSCRRHEDEISSSSRRRRHDHLIWGRRRLGMKIIGSSARGATSDIVSSSQRQWRHMAAALCNGRGKAYRCVKQKLIAVARGAAAAAAGGGARKMATRMAGAKPHRALAPSLWRAAARAHLPPAAAGIANALILAASSSSFAPCGGGF